MRLEPPQRTGLGALRVLTPSLLSGFLAILLVLVAALVVEDLGLRNLYASTEAVSHTQEVKLALQQLLSTALDAETGQRGFIITGEAEYLEPYDRARHAVEANIERIRGLVGDNGEQHADLSRVSDLVREKLAELDEALRQRQQGGFPAAATAVSSNVGKRTMDRLRGVVAGMNAREDAALAVRVAQADASYRTARVTSFVVTAVAFIAVTALFAGTLRYGAERMRAATAAEAQQAQLREALRHKDDFMAVVSHELRTPTNTIVGWAHMLEHKTIRDDQVDKAIAAIGRNATSLRQLIDDLMDTNQLVSGRMRLTTGPVNMADVLADAIDAVRLSADNKRVTITDEVSADLPPVMGDASRLKQIVWNLVANAIKFTPAGGHVYIAATAIDDAVHLEVRDTGRGIEAGFLPQVFERFRQASVPAGTHGGVGLGLAIVRHLVELHGGTVQVFSAGLDKGSTFSVTLPATRRAQSGAGAAGSQQA
jgi:signal transduction histidine kinase